MEFGHEPELDAEGCVVQLRPGYGGSQRIILLGTELAVPEAPSYEGIGGIGFSLGLGEAGSKADLDGPANDADAVPDLVAEGQCSEVLGCLRYGDYAAILMHGADEIGIGPEEGEDLYHEFRWEITEVGTGNDGRFRFGRHPYGLDALRPFGFGRRYRHGIQPLLQEDAPRRRHGGGIRRCLDESGTLSLVLDSTRGQQKRPDNDDDGANKNRSAKQNS